MSRLAWIVRKDVQRFLADRTGALMTVLLPVILASLLGVIFAPRQGSNAVEVLIVDQDGSPAVRKLVDALQASAALEVLEVSEKEARRRLETGGSSVAVLLPAGVARSLRLSAMFFGERGRAELLYDPSRAIAASIAEGIVTQILMQQVAEGFGDPRAINEMLQELRGKLASEAQGADPLGSAWLAFVDMGIGLFQGSPAPQAARKEPGAAGLQPPLELHRQTVVAAGKSAGFNSYAHNFAGMLCMFLLFIAQDMARHLLWERSEGLLSRLRLAPVGRPLILLGTATSSALLATVVSAMVYAVGFGVFGIAIHGSVWGFVAVIVGHAVFVGGFTLLLAGIGRTEQQLANLATFVILIMSFVGGAWFPSFLMPEWVQQAASVMPTHWATEGLAATTWRGLPLEAGLVPAGVLCLFGLACGAVGIRTFRWD